MIQKYVDKDVPLELPSKKRLKEMIKENRLSQTAQTTREYITRIELVHILGEDLGGKVYNLANRKLSVMIEKVYVDYTTLSGQNRTGYSKGFKPHSIIKMLQDHPQSKTNKMTWRHEFPNIIQKIQEWQDAEND